MQIGSVVMGISLSVFSTTVMSYISMATPMGPWIAPTLVLFTLLIYGLFGRIARVTTREIVLAVSAGSIGGIAATACGFYFPTLYFLDPALFNSWMAHKWYFVGALSGLVFVAGSYGFWLAEFFEQELLDKQQLAFPIGQLVHKMIAAKNQTRKAWELLGGFGGTTVLCMLQDGVGRFNGIIAKSVPLIARMQVGSVVIPTITIDIWPMLWAIGFIAGHMVAIPLAVGALSKIVLIDPINVLFFEHVPKNDFLLAFCSGIVVIGALSSFVSLPRQLFGATCARGSMRRASFTSGQLIEFGVVMVAIVLFLSYFSFPFMTQVYLLVGTFFCTHQLLQIAGKIGLAPMGRFATFVMVPSLFLFDAQAVQLTFIATFVGVCIGVATDVLFGRKLARLAGVDRNEIKSYQLLGLVVSALSIGLVFWLLIDHFTLGSPELFAYRAQARRLLIDFRHFDMYALVMGAVFGYVLKKMKLNPMLVFGGLLMPINLSLGLIIGGLGSLLAVDPSMWHPFWSGVFAASSLWMLVRTIAS